VGAGANNGGENVQALARHGRAATGGAGDTAARGPGGRRSRCLRAAFFNNEIPFGGLFRGAEDRKTAEQQAIYGGTVGQQDDPCYHQACDTLRNFSGEVLDLNGDAIAFGR
jgi:hypothetical protein